MPDVTKNTPTVTGNSNAWRPWFTPQAEIWNGRLAMLGFLVVVVIELSSGKGILNFWGIM
ncbi:CAB/ELIP/HLIP superfamily of protein [Calothrix sp. PCC 7716]|nr:CAB/ELIP/HLIP superfamily of protein [Calothrix sp. PCC 7716]